jgi:uncharacterized protein (DUF1501 family)
MSNMITRRHLFARGATGLGAVAMSHLFAGEDGQRKPHFAPRAKRIVYLFQSGGPSQLDLFDYKPLLQKQNGAELPASVRAGQRLTGMSGNQSSFPLAGTQFKFEQHGESRRWVSDLLPHTARIVDKLTFVHSMHTEAINHDPAITFLQTGSQLAGRPSLGAWLSYGLGSANQDLPAFSVLVSKNKGGQPLYARLWGNGFLPSTHQGVQFRPGKDRVLYLADPDGVDKATRRKMLDSLRDLHEAAYERELDPAIRARVAQYEMAYRMQMSVPEVSDVSNEPDHVFDLYGQDARDPGTYAANCLMARRLLERGVRCVQLYHQGWDQHGGLVGAIKGQCRETDKASAALVLDLQARGLLDDTLVVWGGEFGRTNYSQGKLTKNNYGRDHHPRCFTMWMAGGGMKPGYAHGETCEYGYNVVSDPVHVHDLQATILHQLGLDHERLNYRYQGRRFRLTDVHGNVVRPLLA